MLHPPFILGVLLQRPVRLCKSPLYVYGFVFFLSLPLASEKCYLFKLAAFQAQSTVYTGATCLHPKIPRLLFLKQWKLLRWIYVWLYKSNKWWEMKLFAISMAIQNKKGRDLWHAGSKIQDVERDALEGAAHQLLPLSPGNGSADQGRLSFLDSPPWASAFPSAPIFSSPAPNQAEPPRSLCLVPTASSG